jgi:hypothetical protein
MEEHSVFIIYKKENYKYHIVNRKYSASQTISKSYIERSNNMHTHKKTFRIGASKFRQKTCFRTLPSFPRCFVYTNFINMDLTICSFCMKQKIQQVQQELLILSEHLCLPMMTISSWYHWTCNLCGRCLHMLIKSC